MHAGVGNCATGRHKLLAKLESRRNPDRLDDRIDALRSAIDESLHPKIPRVRLCPIGLGRLLAPAKKQADIARLSIWKIQHLGG